MKKFIKTIILFTLIAGFNGCTDDFLDIQPQQSVAVEDAVTDVNTLGTALNGVYSKLQSIHYYGRSAYVIPELMADNLFLSLRNTGRYYDFHSFVVRQQDSYVEGAWNAIYEVAVNASRAIEGGESLGLSGEQGLVANQLIGEAYALRALAHFDLIRLYAQPFNFTSSNDHPGVPIVDRVIDEPIFPSRNNVNEVYDQIIADLIKAEDLMNQDKLDGHFSINGVKALMSRVYLYKEENQEVIDLATEVIGSGDYFLLETEEYGRVWAEDFNPESIFEIIFTVSDNGGTNGLGHFFDLDGYADALATESLYALYTDSDIRKTTFLRAPKPNAEEDALIVRKFPRGTLHDDNVKAIRLAEVYLNRAEAYAKEGEEVLALQDLNYLVQKRDPEATEISLSGQDLLDRILEERRKELAFEGHRLYDLNRNKMNVNIDQGVSVLSEEYPNDRFILPIPLSEINANPNIEPQNPGYN